MTKPKHSDPKRNELKQRGTLHPHPERVTVAGLDRRT